MLPLGSEWFYAKIYCGLYFADTLLKEVFPIIVATISQQNVLKMVLYTVQRSIAPH
jgi:hypothetical protein